MNKRVLLSALCLMMALLCAVPALAQEAAPEAQAPALSDDLYDFQLELLGDVLTLPMKLSDFTALGWQSKDDMSSVTLEPNQYISVNTFEKDGAEVYVSLINTSMEVKPASECLVGEISMDQYQAQPDKVISLAKGVKMGVSSREDVEAAYGVPSSVYEGASYYKMSYEYDSYQDVEIQVDNEKKVVTSIEVRNFVDPNPEPAKVSEEPPQSVAGYAAPAALGEDMMSFNVEYAGALYHLPAPLAAFEANGWKIKAGGDEIVPARGDIRLEIMKDNQTLRAWLYNDSDSAPYAKHCFVTGVKAGSYDADLPITLPGGINRDSTLEQVEAAFEGLETTRDEGDSYISFQSGKVLEYVNVVVDKETNKVRSVEVQYMP